MKETVERYARLLWGRNNWGDAVIAASYQDEGKGFVVTHVPVADCPAALPQWAEELGRPGRSLYVGLAPRRSGLGKGKRGGRADLVGLPALWADIDCSEGAHAAPPDGQGRLPSLDEARGLLVACPAAPSFTVLSGGGLHAYWLSPLPLAPAGATQALRRWRGYWREVTSETGLWVDQSAFDASRSLRLPGSVNPKGGHNVPVVLEAPDDPRVWPIEELLMLVVGDDKPAAKRRKKPGTRTLTAEERVGAVFENAFPVGLLLTEVLGWSQTSEDAATGHIRWHVPGGQSDQDESHAESTVDEDGVMRVWGYSPRAQEQLGKDDQAPVSSWGLLAHLCGSAAAAAKVVEAWQSWPEDERDEKLLAELAGHKGDYAALAEDVVPGSGPAFRRALAELRGARFVAYSREGTDVFAVLGGGRHGVWVGGTRKGPDGEPVYAEVRVSEWVAWREHRTQYVGTTQVKPVKVAYDVEVVLADGRRDHIEMDEEASVSPSAVRARSRFGLTLPEDRKGVDALANVLAVLGVDDREDRTVYMSSGWVALDGGHCLVAPVGSVTAHGVDHTLQVDAPISTIAALGFSELPSRKEIPSLAGAVAALMKIVPGRPDVGVALAGALAAAPLRMARRCSVMLVAAPDTGKSVLSRCAMAWLGPSTTPKDCIYSLKSPTIAAANAVVRWCQDIPLVADDFRRKKDRRESSSVGSALQAILGAGYQDVDPARATHEGGLRVAIDPQTLPLVTGEDTLDEEVASMTRALVLRLTKGEVDLSEPGPLQRYIDTFVAPGPTSPVNRLYASYLSWIAHQLDERGPWAPRGPDELSALESLRNVSERKRVTWYHKEPHSQTRSSEIVAPLAVGIEALYCWAADMSVAHLLPPRDWVDGVLEQMAVSSAQDASQSNPAEQILAWVRLALSTGDVFLNAADNDMPPEDQAYRYGWRRQAAPSGMYWGHRTNALELGTVSSDGSQVIITPGAWVQAARRCDETSGLSRRQVKRDVLQFFGLSDWQRKRSFSLMEGVVLPLEALYDEDAYDQRALAPVVPIRPSIGTQPIEAEASGDEDVAAVGDDGGGLAPDDPGPEPPVVAEPQPESAPEAEEGQGELFPGEGAPEPSAGEELPEKPAKKPPKKKARAHHEAQPLYERKRDPKTGLLLPPNYHLSGPSRFPGEPDLDEVIIIP